MWVSTPFKTRFTIHMPGMATTPPTDTALPTDSVSVIRDVMDTPMEDSAGTAVSDTAMEELATGDTADLDSVMAHTQDTEVGGTASVLRLLSSTDAVVELMESVGESPALALRGDGS